VRQLRPDVVTVDDAGPAIDRIATRCRRQSLLLSGRGRPKESECSGRWRRVL
jgi:hypothetical protein